MDARRRITTAVPRAGIDLRRLDLSDVDSVRDFADGVLVAYSAVDMLINNAGIMMPPRSLSRQGFEIQFATNHLGHFALTGRLLDALCNNSGTSTEARVVTVSAGFHRGGSIHFDDLHGEGSYKPLAYYAQSKFGNVVFGLELDRRLRAAGLPVRSILAHPGYAVTNLQTSGPTGLARFMFRIGNVLIAQNATAGALSQLRRDRSGDPGRPVPRPGPVQRDPRPPGPGQAGSCS